MHDRHFSGLKEVNKSSLALENISSQQFKHQQHLVEKTSQTNPNKHSKITHGK